MIEKDIAIHRIFEDIKAIPAKDRTKLEKKLYVVLGIFAQERTCPICGGGFFPRRADQIYDLEKCRHIAAGRAWRKRKKAKS